MEVIDNVNRILRDDLAAVIKRESRLAIAASCFSIYAYQSLREQLDSIKEFRFIFTSPAFIAEKSPREKREFYIPRLNRERSLYGTDFEVKLRNELSQKAIARECAEWIRKKGKFKSNVTSGNINTFLDVTAADAGCSYAPLNGFTTADLGCERGNNIANTTIKFSHAESTQLINSFNQLWEDKSLMQDVTEQVIDNITAAYNENAPEFIYFVAIYNIFKEFLEDVSQDVLPNEATGFKNSKIWNKLYDFQKDAVLAVINKLEKYNGCILAGSVGLGKTFTALAVIKYYQERNRGILVLCPKKLTDNWNTFKDNYKNNSIAADRLNYAVLYHTDLSRTRGTSNGIDLSRINWGNYDLVVIDESHNFRNGGELSGDDGRENRYLRLLNSVIRAGVKTKVLMLSATPVNNRFTDLRHQLELAYEGDASLINDKLGTAKPIDIIFRNAQTAFNRWSALPPKERTTDTLLRTLDFDFFTLLDSVTIARSRKHIEKYYNMTEIGTFPKRLPPKSVHSCLTDLKGAINYKEIYRELNKLNLAIYTPMAFVLESRRGKYVENPDNKGDVLRITGLERGMLALMTTNLLKRLESSVHSFRLTIERIQKLIGSTIQSINDFENGRLNGSSTLEATEFSDTDFDGDDQNTDFFSYGKKRKIDLADMDYLSWKEKLSNDVEILGLLALMIKDIAPEHDSKLQELLKLLAEKIKNPINPCNKKILIFSAFSDTVEYLYEHVSKFIKQTCGLETAMVTGSVDGRTTLPKFQVSLNNVLTCFSPLSKDKALLMPDNPANIDVLIATDCISEGQNLQDCDFCVNYDIHWNPVRIIQRFGRIDRIGSKNTVIQLVNFWPDLTLDEYINLKSRVETRMKIVDMTATGDDNPISAEQQTELEYRKNQLERLQKEVVDIEDMSTGISIMDLGLNEFRLDLLEYVKNNGNMDKIPFGLHAVVPATDECPPGAVFVLKNRNNSVNIDMQNRLHPFYMVYIAESGEIFCNHLVPKKLLDKIRALCKGHPEPIMKACRAFNKETKDGRNMQNISSLLSGAINSIIETKADREIDSLFSSGGTSALNLPIHGLDDFELICFLVVKGDAE